MTRKELTNECFECVVADYFMLALINSDLTGLQDQEIAALDKWEKRIAPYGAVYETESDAPFFARCDITGRQRSCAMLLVHPYREA